jgi:predicted transcriptional regulator YdeE
MDILLVEREPFFVCGFAVETTAANNDKDLSALYEDFFRQHKDAVLENLNGSKKGFYGLSWYTEGHTRYCHLLGIEVGRDNAVPENAVFKDVPKTTYAVARFAQGDDIIKAWSKFFYNDIPKANLVVNEAPNLYFEYYPDSVHGAYELWVPVVKKDD